MTVLGRHITAALIVLALLLVAHDQAAFGQARPRVSLDLSQMRFDTTLFVRQGGATPVPTSARTVSFARGEIIAGRTGTNVSRMREDDNLVLRTPYELYFVSATGSTIKMKPVVVVEGGGLRPSSNGLDFSGSLKVGLENSESPTTSESVGQDVRVLMTTDADRISPTDISLEHTNLPYETVKIVASNPGDSVRVWVKPSFNPAGIDFSIPVLRPTLSVWFSPEKIQGYGLETAVIVVQLSGVTDPRGIEVSLTSDKSKPEPAVITLDGAGFGQASIRSIGRGPAKVRAKSALSSPSESTLMFVFPMAFLTFTLLGGLIGGAARFMKHKMDGSRDTKWKVIALYLLSGVVFGAILAALSAVGISVFQFEPTATVGEAVVFCSSALGGFGGSPLLSSIIESRK